MADEKLETPGVAEELDVEDLDVVGPEAEAVKGGARPQGDLTQTGGFKHPIP